MPDMTTLAHSTFPLSRPRPWVLERKRRRLRRTFPSLSHGPGLFWTRRRRPTSVRSPKWRGGRGGKRRKDSFAVSGDLQSCRSFLSLWSRWRGPGSGRVVVGGEPGCDGGWKGEVRNNTVPTLKGLFKIICWFVYK